jgi:hypothetical protein
VHDGADTGTYASAHARADPTTDADANDDDGIDVYGDIDIDGGGHVHFDVNYNDDDGATDNGTTDTCADACAYAAHLLGAKRVPVHLWPDERRLAKLLDPRVTWAYYFERTLPDHVCQRQRRRFRHVNCV